MPEHFQQLKNWLNSVRLSTHHFALCLMSVCFLCSQDAKADEQFSIAVGLAKPPYVIQENDTGFELDLIRNITKKMGKSTKFVYTQFGHSPKMLDVNGIDAVMTTNKLVFGDESKLSNEYITYQNVAISLKQKNLQINEIKDLAMYSIASFQKADKVLGETFANAVKASPLYLKVADQSQQPSLLLKERIDVLIMDKNIFIYLVKKLNIDNIDETFTFHPVFPTTQYRMAFKNEENLKTFNTILSEYLQTEEYQLLRKRYNL